MKKSTLSLYEKIDKYLYNYLLSAKFLVDGNLIGYHASNFQNKGDEFVQYKNYIVGNDTSKIDWKVYARNKSLVIKNYREEKNKSLLIIIDGSGSMKYSLHQKSKITKWQYSSILTCGLSYIFDKQRDSVSIGIYNDKEITTLPPLYGEEHLEKINQLLFNFQCCGEVQHVEKVNKIVNEFSAETIIFVSDLLEQEDEILNLFKIYSAQKKKIIFFHILHEDEISLSPRGNTHIHLENNRQINISLELVKKQYQKNFNSFLKKIKDFCKKEEFVYQKISTIEDVTNSLLNFIQKF